MLQRESSVKKIRNWNLLRYLHHMEETAVENYATLLENLSSQVYLLNQENWKANLDLRLN